MVFQNPYASLNPRRRIRDQLDDALALNPDGTWTVESLLEAVDLPADSAQRYSHSFSGGQTAAHRHRSRPGCGSESARR
jgi:ABC-type dipeptide/oligopeptide/nickel transport system ATPase subunit